MKYALVKNLQNKCFPNIYRSTDHFNKMAPWPSSQYNDNPYT